MPVGKFKNRNQPEPGSFSAADDAVAVIASVFAVHHRSQDNTARKRGAYRQQKVIGKLLNGVRGSLFNMMRMQMKIRLPLKRLSGYCIVGKGDSISVDSYFSLPSVASFAAGHIRDGCNLSVSGIKERYPGYKPAGIINEIMS